MMDPRQKQLVNEIRALGRRHKRLKREMGKIEVTVLAKCQELAQSFKDEKAGDPEASEVSKEGFA